MIAVLFLLLVVAVCTRCVVTVWPNRAFRDAAVLTQKNEGKR